MPKKTPPRKLAHSATKSPAVKKPAPSTPPAEGSVSASGGVPVVGIGASAGGLEAFREFLEALPNNTGMAFVLVSHLSKTYKSMLSELLSKVTRMPVTEARGETPLLPNHIYVIPPNVTLSMEEGCLAARPIQDEDRHGMVIDVFFRSLAEHRKSQAIGVVLSGTGTDGTLGLAAIKAEGGIAFAQDQESAKYPDMPRSASAQFGSADFVLPPAQIAKELARIAGHPYLQRSHLEEESEPPTQDAQFAGIFHWVKRSTGVDFSQYKPGTLRRRILRRMVLHKLETVGSYLKCLEADPSEVEALYRDLLINVTSFFREPDTFEYLKSDVIPDILLHRRGDMPIRVWVPGCATGEEAYSIAILLLESRQSPAGTPPVQIFASDISKQAIQIARDGHYPENIAADVSPERLQKFFAKSNGGYQISKQVRDLCIFAVQDVTRDPPFSRVDLISCRNLLIYLGVPLQRKVLAAFHYALNPDGYLLLGNSESVEAGSDAFRQIDKKHKLYSRLLTPARPHLEFSPGELPEDPVRARPSLISQPDLDLGREADRIVLSRYAPPGVLINSSFDILQFRGRTAPFLEQPPGQATLNLLKMAREGLAIDLRAALHQAKKTGGPIRKSGARVRTDSGVTDVILEVTPVLDRSAPNSARNPCYLVLFEIAKPAEGRPRKAPLKGRAKISSAEREMAALRGELAGTQNDLRSIIEEQEATNEELQSANEEILSSNEELQSTNEELETAKEELQATNEELITVNEELQNRNAEMAKVNSDLTNLIESVEVVFVMLDRDLRIRRFTSAAQKVLNLIPSDVGRPIGDIKPNIQVADLPGLIRDAILKMQPREENVRDLAGRSYAMKIRPSKTGDGKVEGAILALTDIDALLRSQENRQSLETSLRSLLRQPPDLLLSVLPEGQPLFVSRAVLAEARGEARMDQSIFEYLAPQDREPVRQCLREALGNRLPAEIEVRRFTLMQGKGPLALAIEPILAADGVLAFAVKVKEASSRRGPASRSAATPQ
jgi:two-component system, chemotaxis family, CheB/CheR fusion protein